MNLNYIKAFVTTVMSLVASMLGVLYIPVLLMACVVAIWIICNELISILENMVDIGIDLPAFLLPLVRKLKTTVDKMGGADQEE